jgi:hypothetical protein
LADETIRLLFAGFTFGTFQYQRNDTGCTQPTGFAWKMAFRMENAFIGCPPRWRESMKTFAVAGGRAATVSAFSLAACA